MTILPSATPKPDRGGSPRLDLHYRSEATFLVAYATQLSKGELFLETERPLPLATSMGLRFHVAGHGPPFELAGTVAWTRPHSIGPGQPAGMGITLLSAIDAHHGERIDDLVRGFKRIRFWLSSSDAAGRAILTRYLQSLVTSEIVDANARDGRGDGDGQGDGEKHGDGDGYGHDGAAPGEREWIDLAIIDLDTPGDTPVEALIRGLRGHESGDGQERAIPILLLAQLERVRMRAAAMLEVDEVLPNPPSFQELQSAVMYGLSRPAHWTEQTPNDMNGTG